LLAPPPQAAAGLARAQCDARDFSVYLVFASTSKMAVQLIPSFLL
jgi:hypothetical protein